MDDGIIVFVSGVLVWCVKFGQIVFVLVGVVVEQFCCVLVLEIVLKCINVVFLGFVDILMFGLDFEKCVQMFLGVMVKYFVFCLGILDEFVDGIFFFIENEFVMGMMIDFDGGWLLFQ